MLLFHSNFPGFSAKTDLKSSPSASQALSWNQNRYLGNMAIWFSIHLLFEITAITMISMCVRMMKHKNWLLELKSSFNDIVVLSAPYQLQLSWFDKPAWNAGPSPFCNHWVLGATLSSVRVMLSLRCSICSKYVFLYYFFTFGTM